MVVDRDRERRADRRFELPDGRRRGHRARAARITHAMCEAFSGPEQNYHTDREMARALGFPDIVVQGMMSVCFVADLLTRATARLSRGGQARRAPRQRGLAGGRDVARGKVRDESARARAGAHSSTSGARSPMVRSP